MPAREYMGANSPEEGENPEDNKPLFCFLSSN